jgi:hypothetical protein
MWRSEENHERFRSRSTKSNIDVRLRPLYCVSRGAKGGLRDVTGCGVFSEMSAKLVEGFRRNLDLEGNNIC